MHGHLELAQAHELECALGHADEADGEGAGGLCEQQGAREDSPAADAAADGEQPEEGHVEEVAVVVDVAELSRQQHDGRDEDEREERRVVQRAPIRARLLAAAAAARRELVGAGAGRRREASQHVAGSLGDHVVEERAVRPEQEDGVDGDEEGGEDAGDDALPGNAHAGADAGDEEAECGRERGRLRGHRVCGDGRPRRAGGKEERNRNHADASELVRLLRRVPGRTNQQCRLPATRSMGRNVRKRDVAQNNLGQIHHGQRERVLGHRPLKLEHAASRNATAPAGHQPPQTMALGRAALKPLPGRQRRRRCHDGTQPEPLQRPRKQTRQAREANQQNVLQHQLYPRHGQRVREPAGVSRSLATNNHPVPQSNRPGVGVGVGGVLRHILVHASYQSTTN